MNIYVRKMSLEEYARMAWGYSLEDICNLPCGKFKELTEEYCEFIHTRPMSLLVDIGTLIRAM